MGRHTLVRADVMMVRDVFDTFYNWKNESEGKWLFDEKEDEQNEIDDKNGVNKDGKGEKKEEKII